MLINQELGPNPTAYSWIPWVLYYINLTVRYCRLRGRGILPSVTSSISLSEVTGGINNFEHVHMIRLITGTLILAAAYDNGH